MPRTVIYDLKGGFGSLKRINALYDIQDDDPAQSSSLWSGQPVVQKAEPIEPSAYQKSLDAGLEPPQLTTESVRYWSDFNRVFYHPRSIVQLNEYDLNSSIAPFERWDSGEELFANLDKEHDLMDRDLRPFAEEADHMQGIQIMTTVDDAWGGFASRYIEKLRDEYGKTTVWVWGLQEGFQGVNRASTMIMTYNLRGRDTFLLTPTLLGQAPSPTSQQGEVAHGDLQASLAPHPHRHPVFTLSSTPQRPLTGHIIIMAHIRTPIRGHRVRHTSFSTEGQSE